MGVLLQSSSGYGGFDGTPLARPGYSDYIITKIFEKSFLREITNTRIDERITSCNQVVQFMIAPEISPWRNYQKNQRLVPSQVTPNAMCVSICEAAYQALKFDKLDIHWACERWESWESAFLDAIYETWEDKQRRWVFYAMLSQVSPGNKGARAGKFKNINLGTLGAPIPITPTNIAEQFSLLKVVLTQRGWWRDGQMFAVVPVEFFPVFSQSNFANKAWVGDSCGGGCSLAVDGIWEQNIMGFKIIQTRHAPYFKETGDRYGFSIIAGHSEAFAYAADIIEGRLVTSADDFGIQYQMMGVYGGAMLYPEAMAIAHWTFQF